MKPKKYKVNLSTAERNEAEAIIKRGKHSASTTKRANILLNLDENGGKVGSQYAEAGINAALYRKKRVTPAIQPIGTGDVEARIIALACSKPPEGRSRWTLRLLEEKVVELNIVETISDNTIGRLLKKHRLSLT